MWAAIFAAGIALLLLAEGTFTASMIHSIQSLEPIPDMPYDTPESVAWAKSWLPALYLVAIQGLLFGLLAIVIAAGLLANRSWAARMLIGSSFLLAATAGVAIVMAPALWLVQGSVIVICAGAWMEVRKWRTI